MNNETIDIIIADKAKGELKEFILQIQEADKEFLKFAGDINQFNKQASTSKLPKDLSLTAEQAERLNKEFAEQSKKIADLEAKIKKLSTTRKRANKLTQEEITNNGILRRNATQYAKANSALSTSYEKLSAKLIIMKRRYKDLSINQLSGNKLTKAQVRELKRLELQIRKTDTALKRVDRSVGESFRNVGNYKSAWKGLGNVVRASIAAFGIYSGIQIAQSIYTDIKAIDGMNKALKQVTETQEAFNRAQQFTTELAEEAGVERIGLTKSYTKFLASAKTTNLTLEQTENIFRQVAKAGAVMNLSTDDINGSFRALEQILSKGKVQAEEIRGQLGERLPGAFQILARSMGLTTAELSKQLELGNVISEEVLPGFADELEKTFRLDKVDKVNTLTAAQNRLGNAWTSFIEGVENGEGILSKTIIGLFGVLSDLIDKSKKSLDTLSGGLKVFRNGIDRIAKPINSFISRFPILNKYLSTSSKLLSSFFKFLSVSGGDILGIALFKIGASLSGISEAIPIAKKELKGLIDAFLLLGSILINPISAAKAFSSGQLDEVYNNLKDKTEQAGSNIALAFAKGYNEVINSDALDEPKQINVSTVLNTNKGVGNKFSTPKVEDVFKPIFDNAKKLKEELGSAFIKGEITHKQWRDAIKEIDKGVRDLTEGIGTVIVGGNPLEELVTPSNQEVIDALTEQVGKLNKEIESVGDNSGESTATAAEAFTFLAQQAQETLGSIGDLTDTLFERRVSKIDDLIQKNSDYYTELLAQEEYSEEQRSRIEAERDAKEAKLQAKKREEQRKQAIANKAFALAEIAINTALAVTSIASTGGGTRYADFGITAGILTALAVASGAAQAAAVIAQPIPKFKDGHLAGTHEGLAMINDQNSPFYQEVVERVDGSMEVYSDRDQIINMNKGDKVHKASVSENMILNHVLENLGISMQPQPRNEGITDAQMDRMASKVYKAMIRGQKGKSTDFDGIASALRKQNRINKI